MSVQYDRAIKSIKELDSAACEANSLWHRLEAIKQSVAKRENVQPRDLEREGIFVHKSPRKGWAAALFVAEKCDIQFKGGYHDEKELELFRHGMETVCNALRAGEKTA